jgi:hypothetical protein
MQVYYTNDATSKFENTLIYGLAGSGKTPIAATAPDTIIIASEPGLKSLSYLKLPYIIAPTYEQANDALKWCQQSNEVKKFRNIFYDSASALSENILFAEKKRSSDARKYSPETYSKTMEIVKGFQNIRDKNVIMTCRAIMIDGKAVPFAAVPKLGPAFPYDFDNVFYITRHTDPNTGNEYSALRCRANDACEVARNRGGRLSLWEPADLTHIFNKSNGVT